MRIAAVVFFAVAALSLFGLAHRSLRAAWRSLRLLRAVRRARSAAFDGVRPGPVALLGRALAIEPLVSTETGRRGVFLSYSADRWEAGATLGMAGHWLRAEQREEAAPFELTDGKSSLLVDPRGARVMQAPTLSLELAEPGGRVRYQESMLEEQAELVVVGHAEPLGGFEPSAAYRGHGYRLTITDGGCGDLIIASPQGLRWALSRQAATRLAGILPALAVLTVLVALLFPFARCH